MLPAFAVHEADDEQVGNACAICQTTILPGEQVGPCPGCGAPFHGECWEENGGCATYGCQLAPSAPKEGGPAEGSSFWGQEEKACPACGQHIRMAALRCRFCGKVFESRAPQAPSPGRPVRQASGRGPAVVLFVAGLIPLTAPVALLIGGPLLWVGWRRVRRWPATSRVMAVLGVVAASVVTAVVAAAVALRASGGAGVEGS